MELRQLLYFVRVAESLNFSEAARSLFVTQSTLSQQIKQLEDEFGALLFERNSHSVTLTENGARLLPLAQKTLRDAKDCKDQISDLKNILTGELIIGITYSFCPILTETLNKFSKTYPGVFVKVVSKTMEELIAKLRKREVDFVLAFKSGDQYEDIESYPLFEDKLSVILRKDHPLANNTILTLKDIERQSMVLPAKGLQARNSLDRNLDITKQNININLELNEVSVLLDLLQSSHELSILSGATIHNRPLLKAIPLDIPYNQLEGCFHILRKTYRKRSAEAFYKMLLDSNEIYTRANKW